MLSLLLEIIVCWRWISRVSQACCRHLDALQQVNWVLLLVFLPLPVIENEMIG